MSKKKDVIAALQEQSSKYLDLVWYARSNPPDHPYWLTVKPEICRGALNSQMRVEQAYPEETAALACPEHGDWNHGFNSGMLAGMRYALEALCGTIEQADELFPELDT